MGIKFFITFLLAITTLFQPFKSQSQETINESENQKNDLINVFLDFHSNQQYIRETINFVNYVRDRQLSDVHIMLNSNRSGTAGRNYVFTFIGLKQFAGKRQII